MKILFLQYLPFLGVALALKGLRVSLLTPDLSAIGLADALAAELGLHCVWVGAVGLALAARPEARRASEVVAQVLLSAGAFVWIGLEAVSATFAAETGGALDHHLFRFALVHLLAVFPVIRSEVPMPQLASVAMILAAGVGARAWQIARRPVGRVGAGAACAWVAAGATSLVLFPAQLPRAIAVSMPVELAFGPWLDPVRAAAPEALSRPPYARDGRLVPRAAEPAYDHVVVVALESTGLFATSLADGGPDTTPFLRDLAARSAVFERAYVAVPHSSKAVVALNCGITPLLVMDVLEGEPEGVPVRCLPDLLRERGFQTLYFGAHVGGFERWRRLMRNLGFAVTTTVERLDTEGFELVNYFAYEDDILLEPTRQWLARTAGRRVYSFYLTSTPHHDYQTPSRYPRQAFSADDRHDRYLNSVYYQDRFLEQLVGIYREAGLYDRTLFVIVGDHGEAFGEHGRRLHDHVIYDEVIRVPLLLHGPGVAPGRHRAIVGQADLPLTLAELIGFELRGESYDGRPLFERGPQSVTRVSCFYTERCLALVTPGRKIVSHFDHAPPEAYAIDVDPRETRNLFGDDPGDTEALRSLHAWKEQQLGRFLEARRALAGDPP
jgi:arylsulfatase A-like enzyme